MTGIPSGWAATAGLVVGYVTATALDPSLVVQGAGPMVRPASGFLLAVLLAHPPRRWPVLCLCILPADHWLPLLTAPAMAHGAVHWGAATFGAAVGAAVVGCFAQSPLRIDRLRTVLALAVGALLAAGIETMVATPTEPWGMSWRVLWGANALGTMLVAASVVGWTAPVEFPGSANLRERAAFLTALGLVALESQTGWLNTHLLQAPLLLTLVPILGWAALRFGPREATAAAWVVTWAVLENLQTGRGVVGALDLPRTTITSYAQAFLGLLTTCTLAGLALATQRRESERTLARSATRFRRLAESTQATPWEMDLRTDRLVYASPRVERWLGYPIAHWYESPSLWNLSHPDDRAAAQALFSTSIATTDEFEVECRIGTADDPVAFDLREAVDGVAQLLAPLAHAKGLAIVVDIPATVPRRAMGDAGRLRQFLLNLAGNAVKFTDEGEVVLGIGADLGADRLLTLHVEVRDTGIGIDAERLHDIFHPFVQADGSTTRRFGGTGLGLSICRKLATLMGGTVTVDSAVGRGSIFRGQLQLQQVSDRPADDTAAFARRRAVVVESHAGTRAVLERRLGEWGFSISSSEVDLDDPRTRPDVALLDGTLDPNTVSRYSRRQIPVIYLAAGRADAMAMPHGPTCAPVLAKPIAEPALIAALNTVLGSPPAPRGESAAPVTTTLGRSTSARILLADDAATNRLVTKRHLEKHGHTVVAVADGRAAVAAVAAGEFDVILMDCEMPGMDGFEATAAIRAGDPRRASTPIFALTAHAMPGYRARCLAAGMDEYLTKPIDIPALLALITPHARRQSAA